MIRIVKRTKKCCVCGKCGEGWLMKSERLENLPPVFLCVSCARLLSEQAAPKKPRGSKTVPAEKSAGEEGKA